MRHVKLYKKRGVPGIERVEEDDNGKRRGLAKGKFNPHASLRTIEAQLKRRKLVRPNKPARWQQNID